MSESTSTRYHFNDTARRTTLASSVAQGDGTIEVNTATNLPSTPFLVAVWAEQGGGNFKYHEAGMEMMEVTAVSGTTLTVTRGVAGTSAMSFTVGDLVETSVQTAQVMDHKLPTVSAAEYTDDTSDGGAAIQAAIDDLPAGGGSVIIPVEGPDSAVVGSAGNWHINSSITTGSKEVALIGPGGQKPVLVAQSSITDIIIGGVLKDIHVDGADLVTRGVSSSVECQRVKVSRCQINLYLDQPRTLLTNSVSINWTDAGIVIKDGADFTTINRCLIRNGDNDGIRIPSADIVSRLSLSFFEIRGTNITTAVNNQGTLVDTDIRGELVEGISGSKFNNVINDVTNTTRLTINGLGYNGANDPASAGDWNGNGKEGVRVLWTSNGDEVISEYRNGSWVIEDAVALIRLGYNVGAGGLPLDAVNRDTIGGVSTSRDTGNNEITISSNVGFQPGNAVPVVMPVQSGVAAHGRVRYSSGNIILGFADSSGTSIDIDADDWEVYVKVEYHG